MAAGPKKSKSGHGAKTGLKRALLKKKFGTKSEISPEVKLLDWDILIAGTLSSTGAATVINSVGEGNDYNARIGRKINVCSVEYHMLFSAEAASLSANGPGGADALRFVLVYDRQPTGSLPAWSDVFTTSAVTNAPMLHRNVNNLDRFEILASDFVDINAGDNSKCFHRYVAMKHDTRFDAVGSGIANISSGAIYVLYADTVAAASNFAYLTGRVRLRFTDM